MSEENTKISDLLERDGLYTNTIVEKPYTLRKLSAKDISPMIKIIKKMNIQRLKNVISELDLSTIMNALDEKQEASKHSINNTEGIENELDLSTSSEIFAKIGETLIFEAIPLILDALDDCMEDTNKFLANVANIELEELENMDIDIYFNLIYDVIKKDEFVGFMKVVSRFLKLEK